MGCMALTQTQREPEKSIINKHTYADMCFETKQQQQHSDDGGSINIYVVYTVDFIRLNTQSPRAPLTTHSDGQRAYETSFLCARPCRHSHMHEREQHTANETKRLTHARRTGTDTLGH